MTLDEADAALCARLDTAGTAAGDTDRVFYDTFDGLVHEAGAMVVHEDGRLALLERSGRERAQLKMARPSAALLVGQLEPGPLRDALAEIVEVRALLPVVHLSSRLRRLDVLDGERKTVARISLEQPALISTSGLRRPLRPRVRVSPVRGYGKELREVRRRLEHDLGFAPADRSLVEEAVLAAGGVPGGTSSKIDVPLAFEQRADAAASAVLRALLEVIEANLPGAIADTDSEFLHDFRVAVRRSRAVQRELRGVFPPAELGRFRDEFRWLQRATGDARDLDVYVLEFDGYRAMVREPMRADLDPLLRVLRTRRLLARREMVRALGSDRASALRREWCSFLQELVELPLEARPDAQAPIGTIVAQRIAKVYRRMVKMGRGIDGSSPAADYHELRKKGKELRYLLELFAEPLYPADVVKPMIRALKALQDVLGRHQDREVQVAMLHSLADEVAALPGGAGALMAMGVLVERLREDEHGARSEFAQRFGAFASADQRRAVKDTFG
jgi:CHAD domain-containing protein